jgi:putative transposase
MRTLFHALMLVLTKSTQRELAKQVQFLQVENQILRSKLPKRISLEERERQRLLKFGKPLGSALRHLISIVSPRTFSRWLLDAKRKRRRVKRGRPPLVPLRDLIIKIASETGWGYTRVHGELRKLTRRKCSRQFVVNVMREHGFEPGPKRSESTWHQFIAIHAKTLWQCDFFSQKVVTLSGIREFFLLAFIYVGTRRVFVCPATANPTEEWCQAQAMAFCRHARSAGIPAEIVILDRDSKFGKLFDAELARYGVKGNRIPFQSPNLQAFIERWILTIRAECLNHFIVLGEKHLDFLVSEFVRHYQIQRPHQGIGNVRLIESPAPPEDVPMRSEIRCQRSLGGLLRHYYRKAA